MGGVKGGPGKRGRGAKLSVRHYPSPSDLRVTWESVFHVWSPSSSICKMGWRSHSVQYGFGIWVVIVNLTDSRITWKMGL